MRKRFFIIFFIIFLSSKAQEKIVLQNGDFIFQSMNCGPLCDAINEVTDGYKGHDFSHMGMVYIKNDAVYIIEASGQEVKVTPWETFKTYTNQKMYVGRLKKKYQKYIPSAIDFSLKQVGVPYDDAYIYNNQKYYCSELFYDAILFAYHKPFFKLEPMTFISPKTKAFFPVWVDYYKQQNIEIPQGQLGCNPGGISKSKKLKIIGTLD